MAAHSGSERFVTRFGSESGSITNTIRRFAYFDLLTTASIASMYSDL